MCLKRIEKASVRWTWRHWNKYRGLYGFLKILSLAIVAIVLAYKASPASAKLPFQTEIQSWLINNAPVVIFMIAWPFVTQLFEKLYSWRLEVVRASDDLSHEDWTFFVAALNNVVGKKSQRFAALPITQGLTAGEVFDRITQPSEQIASLISGLFAFIQNVTNDNSLKIVLAVIENDKPVDWLVYLPMDRVPSKAILARADQTLFAFCARTKEKVAIPDIRRELRQISERYTESSNTANDRGSILCYPIENPYSTLGVDNR